MDLTKEIRAFFKGEVFSDRETLKVYSRDASLFEIRPEVVVAPLDTEDLKNLVKFVQENQGLSLTPRAAGTDMTGGPLNQSIIVDFTRHFNRIFEIGEGYAITQPGVYYRDFEKETLKIGYLLPSYPASREICTVGGMVANNSGGEKTLLYGKTENYVKELKVILRDGGEYVLKALSKEELEGKLKLQNLEGEIYRSIYQLIEDNYELVQNARPRVSKNSAGYFLWNVWDRQNFDLTKLFVGSQGTLGLITEITFSLIKPKPYSRLLVIFLKDLKFLAEIVERVLKHKPESFESYDDHTLTVAMRFLPEILKLMRKEHYFSLALQFLPEFFMIITGGLPKLILIAEFTGDSISEVNEKCEKAKTGLRNLPVKTRITKTEAEAKKYWSMRRESFNLLRHHTKDKQTAPFIDDIIVKPEQLSEFLPKLTEIMNQYDLIYTIAGHIGDGNFHIIPLMNVKDPRFPQIIQELSRKVFDLVFSFGGSMSGEHNDGLIRGPYLKQMYGESVYQLFEKVKQIFDPKNIFNPNKKIGISLEYTLSNLKRE
jgi:FAD/FMN-containing dehydrogenase